MKPNTNTGIRFDGRWYTPDGNGYYYNSHTRKRLHQAIWIAHNGPIPKGYEIHHIDHNKENNDISNLACITKEEHHRIHNEEMSDELRNWYRDNLNTNARPKAIEWHKSEAGKEWHKEHIRQQIKNGTINKKIIFRCSQCGEEFESIARNLNGNHFCSNNCRAKFLRHSRSQDKSDVRVCCICGKTFNCSKWSVTTTCSKNCTMLLRAKNMQSTGNYTKALF
mgnify:CR=1 FL=1